MTVSSHLTLLIDTSTLVQTALLDNNGILIESRHGNAGRADGELSDLVDGCLNGAGATYQSIGAGMVCVGPGSFTGLRIGIAFMQGICFPENLPLYTFSSLRAMNLQAESEKSASVIFARKDHYYYCAAFQDNPEAGSEILLSGSELTGQLAELNSLVIPQNEANYPPEIFENSSLKIAKMHENYPFEGVYKYALNHPVQNGIIKANYIQQSAAETNLKKKSNDSANDGK